MSALLVALGAAVGAPLRYLVDSGFQRVLGSRFPWGTLAVNIVGSLALGVLLGAGVAPGSLALLGVGVCGALTTFSAFTAETVRLVEDGAWGCAAVNVAVSVVAALGAALLGFALGASV